MTSLSILCQCPVFVRFHHVEQDTVCLQYPGYPSVNVHKTNKYERTCTFMPFHLTSHNFSLQKGHSKAPPICSNHSCVCHGEYVFTTTSISISNHRKLLESTLTLPPQVSKYTPRRLASEVPYCVQYLKLFLETMRFHAVV